MSLGIKLAFRSHYPLVYCDQILSGCREGRKVLKNPRIFGRPYPNGFIREISAIEPKNDLPNLRGNGKSRLWA